MMRRMFSQAFLSLLFGAVIVLFAQPVQGCLTCPACRLAKACDGTAPVEEWEIAQALSDLGGSGGVGALPIQPGSWTLAILPDTQLYSQTYPQHFTNQTQWIADHKESHNIKYVLHEGDIVNVESQAYQWVNARASLGILDAAGVPYAIAPGNHDYGTARASMFQEAQNFGPGSPYASQSSIGGFFEDGKTDNSWHTFNANGQDWLILTMEYGPRDQVVAWANDVVAAHPDHLTMMVTHAYMYNDDTIYDWATKGNSQSWSVYGSPYVNLPGGVNDGQELWDGLVKLHENFRFVFNGHVLGDGTGYRGTQGDNGNAVHQMLANYQMKSQGGSGDMRLLEFLADGETVVVRTYSPSLDRYDTAPDQQFTLNMNEELPPPPPPPPPPEVYPHAVVANLVAVGETDPAGNQNIVQAVQIPQSSAPGVTTGQLNRGDYQTQINAKGLRYQDGIMLASVTQHDRPDFVNRRATVEPGRNPYGDGYMSMSIMEAGVNNKEVNFNVSNAWFQFAAGWQGAHVNGNGTLATDAYNDVVQSQVTRTNTGRYTVDLGSNAQNEGMLFAIGNNNDNIVVQTGLLAGGSAWDVRVASNNLDFLTTAEDKDWSFLYLPYDTNNLIGGHYNGAANTHFHAVGDFTMNRLATGQYELTIAGETPTTGMLITTVTELVTSGGVTAPQDNILTYQASSNGSFLINAYDLPGLGFQDTSFVWAFISFDESISLPYLPGDYDRDGDVDDDDYVTWKSQAGYTGYRPADGNQDLAVGPADYVLWRDRRGAASGSGTVSDAEVPEPGLPAMLLTILLVCKVFLTARKRQEFGI